MFQMQRGIADQIIAHAREDAPNECCGVLAGVNGAIEKLYRTRNTEESPYRYSVDPRDLVRIFREVDDNEWSIVGIYHSHTGSAAYPSPTDVRLSENPPGSGEPTFPDALYFIVSVAQPDEPVLKAFHIGGGEIREEEIDLVD
jgi:[CysO sulfur-carrier protein]-S-L-cysteine hydrolase